MFSIIFCFGFNSVKINAQNITIQPKYPLIFNLSPYNTAEAKQAKTDSNVNIIAALEGFVYCCPKLCNTKYVPVQNIPKSKKYFKIENVILGTSAFCRTANIDDNVNTIVCSTNAKCNAFPFLKICP